MGELRLMKGNEVLAEAAIRCGCDGYFGYPITPQSEVMETLMAEQPWNTTGMVVLQAESEVAAINMVYGAAGTGKKVMTSSSSPGISLMAEGISYLAGAELPCLIVNVQRGGPGLGTIQPSQADYFQATKGGGHGDYKLIVLAPSSVQEMNDFVDLGFELAFKYRNPALILTDGAIGQMMEKVELADYKPRWTDAEIAEKWGSWATTGKPASRQRNVITSLELDSAKMETNNTRFQEKYRRMEEEEVRYETFMCDDAEFILVAFGSSARVCQKSIEIARAKGLKRPKVILKHGLKNALIPVVTVVGMSIPSLVGGAVVTEQVFGWPGVGSLMVQSIAARDYPVIMGITVLVAVVVLVMNLVTDMIYGILDPRISYR
ncbi:MAG: 3-methyl-2-oxobutanoate dehydrogenase subunit VorB [Bacteroidia bacterium]|nr:3-methyl-2-oxobutanoate dehydrogenase subunit VorB [Bacteroidia bacterium]